MPTAAYLPYEATRFFSHLVTGYLARDPALQPFYRFAPDAAGMEESIRARQAFPVNREVLVATLRHQYRDLVPGDAVARNIDLLSHTNTFTVCTAHQPNLGTGYLYFVYKILHAIKLAGVLNESYPDHRFVPVYYMGSEDNDLEELGTFRYGDKKFVWDGDGQTGAVGRMRTASLQPLLKELFSLLGPPGPNLDALKDMLSRAYLDQLDIGKATLHLVHALFGRYGLVVLDPDTAALKESFIPVMEDDLLHGTAARIVSSSIEALEKASYKAQAHPRPINLFYLKDNLRERIVAEDGTWQVVNTAIRWDREGLLAELHAHPERFSPNVILRGLYQETILPDIAFIGGGSEVAYWLQLQELFNHYGVFYPSIHLRQSVMWTTARDASLRQKLGLGLEDLFLPEADLIRHFVARHTGDDWKTEGEALIFEKALQGLKAKAAAIDPTLRSSTEAVLTKIRYQLQVLEKKMLRAEKRKLHTLLEQLHQLKASIFPGGSLQERRDNFMPLFLQHGFLFFDILLEAIDPLHPRFLILEEK